MAHQLEKKKKLVWLNLGIHTDNFLEILGRFLQSHKDWENWLVIIRWWDWWRIAELRDTTL